MPIIPLEKLIEYKGNRYELSRAMIELAKNGGNLLRNETEYRDGKYIPTVMKNILDGKIKYEYETNADIEVDEEAPFKISGKEYDAEEYSTAENKEESEEEDDDDDDEEEVSQEEEQPKKRRRRIHK